MNKQDLRVIKTKEILKEALLSLLKNKNLESISITEICRTAKVNRGTFYSHYGQVGDLFEEYFKEIMKDLTASYMEPYEQSEILHSYKLNPSTIRIFHHIENYEKFYRIVFSHAVPLAYYYLLFDHIRDLFKKDIGNRNEIQLDPAMLSAYHANAILGLVIEWHREDFRQSAAELNEMLVYILNYRF